MENQQQTEQPKYIVNVVYQRPYITEDNQIHSITDMSVKFFSKYKEAKKFYDALNKTHIFEEETVAGKIAYFCNSSEFVVIAQLEEFKAKQAELEAESRVQLDSNQDESDNSEVLEEVASEASN